MSVELLEVSEVEKLAPITKVELEISRMQTAFSGLTIKDANDREGYGKVTSARKEVKGVRVQVEKERKLLIEDALKWQRQVNEVAKEITGKLSDIEQPLQKMEDEYLAEKERIKAEEERLRKEKIRNRAQVVTSFSGVNFNGSTYKLGNFTLEQFELEMLSDDRFQTRVEELESEYQIILTARLEAERIAKEEAARLEAQRKEQEAQAAEIKRQQEEIAAERKRIADEQTAREAAIKREQDLKETELRRQKAEIEARERQIKHQQELEIAKKEAAEKAIKEAELKVKRDAEAKAEADRLEKEAELKRLALRPDIEKFNDMTTQIIGIVKSVAFKTKEGKAAQSKFRNELEALIKTAALKAE